MAWDWLITFLVTFVALGLAMARSSWAVDFTVYVFVFNRGVRRWVDYSIHHEFSPLSPLSLTPLLAAAAMLLPVLLMMGRLPPSVRSIFLTLSAAIIYAFALGYVNVQIAAVYALAEALAPLSLFGYVLLLNPDIAVRDRWVRSFAWGAILTSMYGWYQYLTIPPWDKFWLIETKMYGYMGIPEPTQMTVFSTMAERGPLAGYLGFSVVPMIVSKKWRPLPGIFGWAGVILVFSVILLTLSRAGLLFALIGTVTYLIINRGQGAKQIAFAAAVLGVAGWFGMERIPNAERVTKRFETIGELPEDGSFEGRVEIMSYGLPSLLHQPFGKGLGGAGLATRVNTGSMKGQKGGVVDAGWFNIILIYGIPGTGLLLMAMAAAWRLLGQRFRDPRFRDGHVLMARAMMISLIPACFVGDLLTGFSIFWLALGCGIVMPRLRMSGPPVPVPVPSPRGGESGGGDPVAASRPPMAEQPAQPGGFWLRD